MIFSTYGLYSLGIVFAVVVTAALGALTWVVERTKQRRFNAVMEAEVEAHADPTAPRRTAARRAADTERIGM